MKLYRTRRDKNDSPTAELTARIFELKLILLLAEPSQIGHPDHCMISRGFFLTNLKAANAVTRTILIEYDISKEKNQNQLFEISFFTTFNRKADDGKLNT